MPQRRDRSGAQLAIFGALAGVATRFRWLIVVVWIVGVIAAGRLLPSLSSVTQANNAHFLPASSPSVQASRLATPFQGADSSGTAIIVANRGSGPLTAADTAAIGRAEQAARGVPGVSLVRDEGTSRDGRAAEALVSVTASVSGSHTASQEVVDGVRAAFTRVGAPPGLRLHLAGPLATSVDAANTRSGSITKFTLIFVIVLLFVARSHRWSRWSPPRWRWRCPAGSSPRWPRPASQSPRSPSSC